MKRTAKSKKDLALKKRTKTNNNYLDALFTLGPEFFDLGGLADTGARDRAPVFMSSDSATRKLMPIATGCLQYFPDALLCVAFISRVGNDKHNPGQPLHWAKEKSADEPDAEVRHLLDHFRGAPAEPGLEPLGDLGHLASKAWRALAHLQRACDAARVRGV